MNRKLSTPQIAVLVAAFVPMLGTGVAGGFGTYSNISSAYGTGTALGAVAAGEGATAVLALVLLGLTMLGQASPRVVRVGLWALPATASVMAAMAAPDPGRTVIYAATPLGMTVSAEGMAFLARRIVVHTDGRDAEAEARAADVVRALAYHRARAANHPSTSVRKRSERVSWRLARKVGTGDQTLGGRLVDVQRDRVTDGADAALAAMFTAPVQPDSPQDTNTEESTQVPTKGSTADLPESTLTRVPVNPTPMPRAVAVGFLKSALPLKPFQSIAPALDPAPAKVAAGRAVAAESAARPRRATGRIPEAARSNRPKRTAAELLEEARAVAADWPDAKLTAEGLRLALHTSPKNARMLRETLRAERAATAGAGT